jgi:dUTP pyrophosphatase
MFTLEICPENEDIKKFYISRLNHSDDSGVDLFVPENISFGLGQTKFIDHKVKCRMLNVKGETVAYYLYPRSSISKTPLTLANSVGIIDKNYRGNIIAACKHNATDADWKYLFSNNNKGFENRGYELLKSTRLVQICAPDLSPIQIKIVDSLDETERGSGGFGSTGN